jgi:hypothetical protein
MTNAYPARDIPPYLIQWGTCSAIGTTLSQWLWHCTFPALPHSRRRRLQAVSHVCIIGLPPWLLKWSIRTRPSARYSTTCHKKFHRDLEFHCIFSLIEKNNGADIGSQNRTQVRMVEPFTSCHDHHLNSIGLNWVNGLYSPISPEGKTQSNEWWLALVGDERP